MAFYGRPNGINFCICPILSPIWFPANTQIYHHTGSSHVYVYIYTYLYYIYMYIWRIPLWPHALLVILSQFLWRKCPQFLWKLVSLVPMDGNDSHDGIKSITIECYHTEKPCFPHESPFPISLLGYISRLCRIGVYCSSPQIIIVRTRICARNPKIMTIEESRWTKWTYDQTQELDQYIIQLLMMFMLGIFPIHITCYLGQWYWHILAILAQSKICPWHGNKTWIKTLWNNEDQHF